LISLEVSSNSSVASLILVSVANLVKVYNTYSALLFTSFISDCSSANPSLSNLVELTLFNFSAYSPIDFFILSISLVYSSAPKFFKDKELIELCQFPICLL
jgi:hypothetical protein